MNDYEQLKEFYDEADKLIGSKVTAGDQRFKDWELKVSRYLSHRYGIQSVEMEEFRKQNLKMSLILTMQRKRLRLAEKDWKQPNELLKFT